MPDISNPFTNLKILVAYLRGDPDIKIVDVKLALRYLVDAGFVWWLSFGEGHIPPPRFAHPDPHDRGAMADYFESFIHGVGLSWDALLPALLDFGEWLFDYLMRH